MADESSHLPNDQNLDYHIVTLIERLDGLRKDPKVPSSKMSMQTELRTLTFWRAIISECLASFLYVFIACGAAAGVGVGASISSIHLSTSLATGLSMTVLTHCFFHISGAHINPAVTLATAITRLISPLRAAIYILAQCGGGIAGVALLFGLTFKDYRGNLNSAISHAATIAPWERFGVEFVLTFVVVFTYFVSTNSCRKYVGNLAAMVGCAYGACTFVSMPYLNPARALGPSFVLDRWENHWVSWMGTLAGGAVSGILYEIIFSTKRSKLSKEMDDSSSSMNSEEDNINYDLEMDKPDPAQAKYHGSTYNGYRNVPGNAQGYCQTVYATGSTKVDRVESIYGGTRSLYCKSPPLTRANLHQLARSQSVYAKSQTAINRDTGSVRAGPLVPAQSLYPLQVSSRQQNTHLQNQNVQNQLQQVNSRSESIYGIRSSMRQQQPTSDRMSDRVLSQDPQVFQPIYGSRTNQPPPVDNMKFERDPRDLREARESRDGPSKYRNRPDSVYGARRPGQSAQSDDSSYGSYHGSTLTPPANGVGNYQHNQPPQMQQIIQQQQSNYGILPPPAQQIERKISSSTVQQQQQRPVEFVAQKPNASLQQQQPQNYAMHPIRQN